MSETLAPVAPLTQRATFPSWWNSIPALYMQAAVGIALLIAGVMLYAKGATMRDSADGPIKLVQRIQQQETRWNEQVMLAAFGYARNFDAVNRASQELADAVRNFSQIGSRDTAPVFTSTRTALALATYQSKLDRRRELAERMKSAHAIISNSAAYLPTLTAALDQSMNAALVDESTSGRIWQSIKDASIDLAAYIAHPADDLATSLRAKTVTLTGLSANANVPAELGLFALHIGVVLRNTETLHESTLAFSNVDTDTALQALLGECNTRRDREVRIAQWMSMLAAAAAWLGIAMLMHAVIRSVAKYRMLSRSNDELKSSKDEVETQLIQAVKMSAIGQMVAGIVHEINTPLAYVKATFEFLRDQILSNAQVMTSAAEFAAQRGSLPDAEKDTIKQAYIDDLSTLLEDGLHGIEQISTLVMSLKNFSRLDHGKLSEFSVEEGLSSSLAIARHSIKHVADVYTDFGNVPRITGSPSHINQVFLNVIMNAAHAMQGRGERGRLDIATRLAGNDMIVVTIADDGPGIPPDVLPRIFDLYFTTKPPGQGTGVGLAICYRIVRSHQGRIEVQSKPGVGTTFSIFLPVHARTGADPSA